MKVRFAKAAAAALAAAMLLTGCGSSGSTNNENLDLNSMSLEEIEEKAKEEGEVQANFYHSDVVPAMEALRAPIDKLEMIIDKEVWPMPSYGDLIFEV